jgi:hypothetical protein
MYNARQLAMASVASVVSEGLTLCYALCYADDIPTEIHHVAIYAFSKGLDII